MRDTDRLALRVRADERAHCIRLVCGRCRANESSRWNAALGHWTHAPAADAIDTNTSYWCTANPLRTTVHDDPARGTTRRPIRPLDIPALAFTD